MKVTFVTRIDAGLFMGGGEIQALKTAAALKESGVEVANFDPWTTDLGDIVHFFGPFPYYTELRPHLDARKVPFVVSPIFMSDPAGINLKWRYSRRRLFDRTRYQGWHWLLTQARKLFVLSRDEEARLRCAFGSIAPCASVPNGVEERFANGDAEAFRSHYGISGPFVLHCGRFEIRKNQWRLINALRDEDIQVVFIGEPTVEAYYRMCRSFASDRVRFLDPIPNDSPLLAGAYAACSVFALPSTREILSLAALEAAMAGKPLVLGNTWGASEHFDGFATFVDPRSIPELRAAVMQALKRGDSADQIRYYREHYSWHSVATRLIAEYEAVLRA
ncbi:MAG: hypothetical protein HONBIEJF_02499 [Fimbriimonadaceae bacterium]|nr:hypothetical protein [Fimbriimonadaceae bacterium]